MLCFSIESLHKNNPSPVLGSPSVPVLLVNASTTATLLDVKGVEVRIKDQRIEYH